MKEFIENVVRAGVLEAGRGRLVEGSVRMHERHWTEPKALTWYVRYQVLCSNGRRLWYGAEFSARGALVSSLFC